MKINQIQISKQTKYKNTQFFQSAALILIKESTQF